MISESQKLAYIPKAIELLIAGMTAALLISLTGCYNSYYVDRGNINLHTEAEHGTISYVWDQEIFTIWLSDSKRDLLNLRVLPATAFIWRDSTSYQLTPITAYSSLNSSSSYNPKDGRVSSIGYNLKLDNPRTKREHFVHPLKPGLYNISIQFNGASGIFTLCGSFKISKELKPFPNIQG